MKISSANKTPKAMVIHLLSAEGEQSDQLKHKAKGEKHRLEEDGE